MDGALDIIIFIIQGLLVISLLYCAYRLIRFFRTVSFDKRFGPYSVEILDDSSESLFDVLTETYSNIRKRLSKKLVKSKLLSDYSNKYEKYSSKSRISDIDKMNYISASQK